MFYPCVGTVTPSLRFTDTVLRSVSGHDLERVAALSYLFLTPRRNACALDAVLEMRSDQNHNSMFAVSCRRPPRPRLLALRVGAVLTLLEDASAGCTRLLAAARTKRQLLPP